MRIGIIGQLGGTEVFNDGQTIKTRSLYESLKRRYAEQLTIHTVDTYYLRTKPWEFCIELFRCMLFDKKIIVLLSKRVRRLLFPLLAVWSRLFKKEIYHYGIGGLLADEAKVHKRMKKSMTAFRWNWLESPLMVEQFRQLNMDNAIYIPNFKPLHILKEEELVYSSQEPFCFCTFSRVIPEKGIEDAIRAISKVNQCYGRCAAQLDIYGPIGKGYEGHFRELLTQAGDCCRYCGVVPAYESVEVLPYYYALLFPTRWLGEGCPGTIIDAMSSGIPVISSRWKYSTDMITHGENGFLYDSNDLEQLVAWILYAMTHPEKIQEMKPVCLARAQEYSEETVMRQILKLLEL